MHIVTTRLFISRHMIGLFSAAFTAVISFSDKLTNRPKKRTIQFELKKSPRPQPQMWCRSFKRRKTDGDLCVRITSLWRLLLIADFTEWEFTNRNTLGLKRVKQSILPRQIRPAQIGHTAMQCCQQLASNEGPGLGDWLVIFCMAPRVCFEKLINQDRSKMQPAGEMTFN